MNLTETDIPGIMSDTDPSVSAGRRSSTLICKEKWISGNMSADAEGKNRERWLDCARTIAIVLVTFNHAANRAFASDKFQEFMTRPHVISFLHAVLNVLSRMGCLCF